FTQCCRLALCREADPRRSPASQHSGETAEAKLTLIILKETILDRPKLRKSDRDLSCEIRTPIAV
ncbi:hypothetical protein, partial [Zarconia navalis]|uniref:hypothetical protein n=1 Tax=Zarconia navalis TaxID=2992134 RepID=UPI0021F8DD53